MSSVGALAPSVRWPIEPPPSTIIGGCPLIEPTTSAPSPAADADLAAIDALDANKRVGWGGPLVDQGDKGKRPRDEPIGDGGHPNYPFRMLPDGNNDATVF